MTRWEVERLRAGRWGQTTTHDTTARTEAVLARAKADEVGDASFFHGDSVVYRARPMANLRVAWVSYAVMAEYIPAFDIKPFD